MSFEAIRDVSVILQRVLQTGLNGIGATCLIHDLVSTPSTSMTLTLTLYEIGEDASGRNRPDVRTLQGNQILTQRSPAAILLRYVLTAWSGNFMDDQLILGRAVQTLYDNAIISGPLLANTVLAPQDQAIAVTMIQQSIEDRTHVWQAYNKPYRLSVNYETRVVKIDSRRPARVVPTVRSRHHRHGILEETP